MEDIIEASFDVKETCGGTQAGAMGRVNLVHQTGRGIFGIFG